MSDQEQEVSAVPRQKKTGPDTCWHVILLITAISFVGIAIFRTAGYQYVAFMHEFRVDRETASWPQSLMTGLAGMTGLLVGPIQKRFSATSITVVGSMLAWVGVMTSGLARGIFSLSVTLGVIHGVGTGIVFVLLQVFIMMYFDKFRASAVGISEIGMTASSFVFTRLLELLNNTYGFRNTFFIMGALLMNMSPLAYMLKVPHWHKDRMIKTIKQRSSSEKYAKLDHEYKKTSIPLVVQEPASTVTQDMLVLMRTYSFHLIVLSAATSTFIYTIVLTTMLDYALDKGSSYSSAVWLISCLSITDVFGRLGLPLLTDTGCLKRSTMLIFNQFFMGTVLIVAPYASIFWHVVVVCCSASTCIGCGVILHDVLIPDLVGLERLALVHGAIGTLRVPMMLGAPALIGHFRDRTGSYDHLYWLQGTLLIATGFMWLAATCGKKCLPKCSPPHCTKELQYDSDTKC